MSDIRWLALLPDPVTGRQFAMALKGRRLEWLAPDRQTAIEKAALDLSPSQLRLAEIASVLEYEQRLREPVRKPIADFPKTVFRHGRRGI